MEAGELNPSGIKNLVFVKGISGTTDGAITLKAGDTIQARVIAVSEDNVILNIGGSRISASTNLSLSPGETVSLMVIEVGPEKVVLRQLTGQGSSPVSRYMKDDLLLNSTGVLNMPVDSQAKELLCLPLPIRLGDELRTADIRIYRGGSGGKPGQGQSSFTVAFALDMPAIGKTRAWVELVDKFISFSITTESREAMKEARSMFGELERSFNDLGYTVGRLSAVDAKEETPKSLIEEKVGVRPEGIDFKA